MSCCGDREKLGDFKLEQTWDYINLDDFKSSSCFTGFSYFLVWLFLGISIAVYGVDTFTAINLLVFNKWSSQIEPKIPFSISRWIFAGCIIASFVLLAYRWFRAIRVMRTGSVAESYLDPLAVRVQSIRVGKSKGYRRFLVFAELTKSKKGADYVALFTYFSFESWLRVIFADGPRQVINAITLYSVMELDLIPTGSNAAPAGTSPVAQFFINIKALAEKNYHQAVILFGMLFTLIIWVIAALSLICSVILYLIFLWHHIPTMDGSLKRYCRRKINTRLDRIVRKKTAVALSKGGLQLKDRAPTMPLAEGEELKPVKVAPTLPSVAEYSEDKKPIVTVTPLSRQPTQSTLPPYSSEPEPYEEESYRQPKLPDIGDDGSWLTKTNTQNSAYGESASLTGGAAPMGYSPLDTHYGEPTLPAVPPVPSSISHQGRPYAPSMNRQPIGSGRPGPTGPIPMEGFAQRPGYGPGYSQTPPPAMMNRETPGFPRDGPSERSYSPAGRMPYDRPYPPAINPALDRQQTHMYGMRSNSPTNNVPPGRSLTSPSPNYLPSAADPVSRRNTPGNHVVPPNQGGYVAFNPFSSHMNTNSNANARSESPISSNHELTIRPPTTEPSHNSSFQSHPPIASDLQPIIRPATTEPANTPTFQSYPPIVRAATTTPSDGYRRHEPSSQHKLSHTTVEEEDDDEYDPLSYYGSAA